MIMHKQVLFLYYFLKTGNILYNIYLIYFQYIVYLHNEDKEHIYMYLGQISKRKRLFLENAPIADMFMFFLT